MDEGAHLLDALRPPQAQQDEEQDTHAEKVADGSDHMHKQDDGIDAHDVLLVDASCTRAALMPGKMNQLRREVLAIASRRFYSGLQTSGAMKLWRLPPFSQKVREPLIPGKCEGQRLSQRGEVMPLHSQDSCSVWL